MVFQVSSFNRCLISSCLGASILVTACGPIPTNTPLVIPTCISSASEANPYYSANPQSEALQIYTDYKNNPFSLELTRQEAFSKLAKYTQQFSDYVDVGISDTQMIRIMVTYIDPILVEFMALNHVLLSIDRINSMAPNDFKTDLTNKLGKLAERNELLFIVTITAPSYREQAYNSNVLTVQIPIRKMTLTSAANLEISPIHDDHILEKNIDITHGPVSGYIGYPISVIYQNNCTWVMDLRNTMLTLGVPSLTLGATTLNNPQTWNIPYQPLIAEDIIPIVLVNKPVPTFDTYMNIGNSNNLTPAPPNPNWNPNVSVDNTDWKSYWESMGRYLWYWSMMENYR